METVHKAFASATAEFDLSNTISELSCGMKPLHEMETVGNCWQLLAAEPLLIFGSQFHKKKAARFAKSADYKSGLQRDFLCMRVNYGPLKRNTNHTREMSTN